MPHRIPSTSEVEPFNGAMMPDVRGLALAGYLIVRIRPLKIGVVALALAIFLWGTGSRLARYHLHPDAALRVSTAKLWDETRSARAVDEVLRKAQTPPPSVVDALTVTETLAVLAIERRAGIEALHLPLRPDSVSTLPSRAPPALRCFLA